MPRFKRYDYQAMSERAVSRFRVDRPNVVAVDTETTGFAWEARAFCVTLTWRDRGRRLRSFYLDLESDDLGVRRETVRYILSCTPEWVFHNAKFDLQKLILEKCIAREQLAGAQVSDTNIIHALIDENSRHGLKYLATKLLGESTNEEKVLAKVRRELKIKKDEGYHLLPRQVVVPYAMKDTELTLKLYEYLWPKLPADCHELYYAEVETAIALLDIEANGIGLDVPYLERTASEYGVRLMRLDQELQALTVDESIPPDSRKAFNPNSPKQITEAFARCGQLVESTDKTHLTELAKRTDNSGCAELAQALLEHRRVKKLHGTYLVGMLAEQHGGIIHPNFNLTLPRTGRMSSSAASNN